MKFQCAICDTIFRWKADGLETLRCPHCGKVYPVPPAARAHTSIAAEEAAISAPTALPRSKIALPVTGDAPSVAMGWGGSVAVALADGMSHGGQPEKSAEVDAEWIIPPLPAESSRRWWQLSLSCSISLLIHSVALVVCMLVLISYQSFSAELEIESRPVFDVVVDQQTTLEEDRPNLESQAPHELSTSSVSLAAASSPVSIVDPAQALPAHSPDVQVIKFSDILHGDPAVLALQYDDGGVQIVGEESHRFREAVGIEEAVGGLVGEIRGRLEQGNLLVLWLFDASNSLQADRAEAARHLEPLLKSLDAGVGPYQLQHTAVGYGQLYKEILPPTADSRRLVRSARSVPTDATGKENVLNALGHSVSYSRKKWDDRIMVVIWTDESGDDLEHLETAIALCQEQRIAVTVVGAAASFGRREGQQRFSTRNQVFYLPVDKGPESGIADRVGLPSLRHDGSMPLYHHRPDIVSSGFGPYGLVRLARETGGSYLIYDRDYGRQFAGERLRDYAPDYRSVAEIEAELAQHPVRAAVVEASRQTAELTRMRLPQLDFYRVEQYPFNVILYSDFGTRLAGDLKQEIGHAGAMSDTVEQALTVLDANRLESEHSREPTARWRAAYDLARGELLAASVQFREYALVCQQLLSQGLQSGTNRLTLSRGGPLRSGTWGADRLQEANRHFARLQADHPGTPWAQQGHTVVPEQGGYQWRAESRIPSRSGGGGGGGGLSLPRL